MTSSSGAPRARITSVAFLALFGFSFPTHAHALVFPCTDGGVQAAVASGGLAEIGCATQTTIVVSATRMLAPGTILDGNGLLVLSGGGVRTVLEVPSGVTATVRDLVIENGANGGGYGGGLRVSGNLTVNATTIRGCTASAGGPAVWVNSGGTLAMNASTVTGNSGGAEGMVTVHGTATLTNTTITDNGLRGVGVRYGGSATLDHCTVVASMNEALFGGGSGTFTVGHSILVNLNGSPSIGGAGGTFVSQGYNIIGRTSSGLAVQGDTASNLNDVQPLLGPLADNGGPTQTRALLACSPGIDAGATSMGPAQDQRGQPRVVNGARDIGAFESSLRPCVYLDDVTRAEGNNGTTTFTVNARLSGPSAIATQVSYATANGTATTADGDYLSTSGTLSFAARATTASFAFSVLGEQRFEPDETVLLQLSAPMGISLGDADAVATISNDDARPTISIADATTPELDTGTHMLTFTVTLDVPSSETVTVSYVTVDETATVVRGDYDNMTGFLTFMPGTTTRTITVPVHADTTFEINERFGVLLSNPSNATILRARATGNITNDDTMPSLVVDNTFLGEGDSGFTETMFSVSLSNASDSAISVDFATASQTATSGTDFVPVSGQLTFAPGTYIRYVVVNVVGDRTHEATETFGLALSEPVGATIASGMGTTMISNDDPVPVVSIEDARATEGHAGTTALTFSVSLDRPSDEEITVPYETVDGTATITDGDYDDSSGLLTFAPGATHAALVVTVHGDARFEGAETLQVTLGTPTGANLGDASGLGTIDDDDTAPERTLTIGDVSVSEGDEGTTNGVLTVSLDAAHDQAISVRYTTTDATAHAGSDYTEATGTLTFAPGETTRSITVALTGDTVREGDETLRVELDMAVGATIVDGVGVLTVLDDEASPGLSIGSATIAEGDHGTRVVEVTVTLTGASAQYVTVDWATADDTATLEDDDFAEGLGALVFPPGVTSRTVRVVVVGDAAFEADEQLFVRLSNAVGADIAVGEGTISLTNDDAEMPMTSDAGVDAEVDAGTPTSSGGGCAVATRGSERSSALGVILLLAWVVISVRGRRART